MAQKAGPLAGRPRRDYIDALKGLGIILVVGGHFIEYYRFFHPFCNAVWECIYMFHMALFCLCSGMLARFNPFKLVFQQVWIYLLSQAVMLWFRLQYLPDEVAAGATLEAWLLPWRHMWYLYSLIFWELTVPLLCLARDKGKLPGSLAAMAAALAVGLLGGLRYWSYSMDRTFAFYPLFACGVLFSRQFDALDRLARRWWGLRLAALAAFAAVYLHWLLQALRLPEPVYEDKRLFHGDAYTGNYTMFSRFVWLLAGVLTAIALLLAVGRSKWLASLGRRTLSPYILHMLPYAWLIAMGMLEPPKEHGVGMVLIWTVFITGCFVSFLASAPVSAIFGAVANVWYKGVPALVRFVRSKLTEQ